MRHFFTWKLDIFIYKETLEKTEGHKNGQYRETGNIGYIRMDNPQKLATQGTEDEGKQTKNTTQNGLNTFGGFINITL